MREGMTNIAQDEFRFIKKIASGAFGEIHVAVQTTTLKKVAIKIEKKSHLSQLLHEYRVYKEICDEGGIFLPGIYGYFPFQIDGVVVYGMVMDLLSLSLQELFEKCNRRFTLKTVLMIGDILLSRIEYVHFKNYLHRDIKPDNFAFGLNKDKNNLFIIDFGLAKCYRNPITYSHIPSKTGKSLTGTARYASLNTHNGLEQGRRDDLESLAYCLIYFLKGSLPWQGLPGATKQEKYRNIRKKKEAVSVRELCEGLPSSFSKFLYYVRALKFQEMPSYLYLRNILASTMKEHKFRYDGVFDWSTKKE